MSRVISFFPKNMYAGGVSDVNLYSPVFDVTEYSQIVAELRVYFTSGGGVTGIIEESSASCLDPRSWSTLASDSTSSNSKKIIGSDPLRFVRAKVTIPAGAKMVFSFEAEARESPQEV